MTPGRSSPLRTLADPDHRVCTALLQGDAGPLVTTALVATEAAWLIRRELGARSEAVFFQAIAAGELRVEALTGADWGRVADLVTEYDDFGLDAADASVVAMAERLGADTIATLDHRDFRGPSGASRDLHAGPRPGLVTGRHGVRDGP